MNIEKYELAIISITKHGIGTGRKIKEALPGSHLYVPEKFAHGAHDEYTFALPTRTLIKNIFCKYKQLILIMAVGAAVRLIISNVKDKREDPAVVVIDDSGKFAISLLSGHIGGANELTTKVSSIIGAQPVITTASDNSGAFSLDLAAKSLDWEIENPELITRVSAAIVNGESVALYQDAGETDCICKNQLKNIDILPDIKILKNSDYDAAIIITDRIVNISSLKIPAVILRPKSLVLGIGCNRGTCCSEIEEAVSHIFTDNRLSTKCIKTLATIDLKNNEAGLLEYAKKHDLPIKYFNSKELNNIQTTHAPSQLVQKHVGTESVCEAAALLASNGRVIVNKTSFNRKITIAVSRVPAEKKGKQGKLFLVGIGPGAPEMMTFKAKQVINASEVVIGYHAYINLIKPLLVQKTVYTTAMGKEIERVNQAIDLARQGEVVSLISSGDSGVYGMAGLVGEILLHQNSKPEIELVPGIPAMVSAAALLGAPLNGDIATISLSDYLVPWDDIERRINLAAEGDFVIALYNPKSSKRQRQLEKARDIILKNRISTTPVGIVFHANRPGQKVVHTDLETFLDHPIDMNALIIIGNSKSIMKDTWMITPRGYQTKYRLEKS